MATERAYFIIADITGYTQFLTQSELEHAQDILSTLFQVMLDNITPPIKISNFQGDAILSYVPESHIQQGQTLLEAAEAIYFAFRRSLANMRLSTTCTCTACRNIPNLDLKFFIHYGAYTTQKMGDREELSGPDVILVHRLLKNTVTETTKKVAYVLLTEQAVEAMGLEEYAATGMISHTETYEHLGEIQLYVRCLHTAWGDWQAQQHIVADVDELQFTYEVDLPFPPAVVWEYLHNPAKKVIWLGVKGLTEVKPLGIKLARMGVDGEHHCAHGEETLIWKYRDWRPFDYSTFDYIMPMDGWWRNTNYLTPTASGGTRIKFDVEKMMAPDKARTVVLRKMAAKNAEDYEGNIPRMLVAMQKLIEDDIASGEVMVESGASVDAGALVEAATAEIPVE